MLLPHAEIEPKPGVNQPRETTAVWWNVWSGFIDGFLVQQRVTTNTYQGNTPSCILGLKRTETEVIFFMNSKVERTVPVNGSTELHLFVDIYNSTTLAQLRPDRYE